MNPGDVWIWPDSALVAWHRGKAEIRVVAVDGSSVTVNSRIPVRGAKRGHAMGRDHTRVFNCDRKREGSEQ